MRAGMRARAAVTAELFAKLLRLSPVGQSRVTDGQVGNMLLNDTQRVLDSFTYFHFCWFGFLEITVFAGLLAIDVGLAVFFGILVLLLLVPAQICFSVLVKRARGRTTAQVDVRVQKMTEILSGIRTVKLAAWEPHFKRLVAGLRRQEVKHLKVAAVLRALNAAVFFTAPVMVALATFAARTLIFRKPLSPPIVFSSLSYFWSISMSLNLMPLGYLAASEATVSSRRLDDFFDLDEIPNASPEARLDVAVPSAGGAAELTASDDEEDPDRSDTDNECHISQSSDVPNIDTALCTACENNRAPRIWTRRATFCYAQSSQSDVNVTSTVLTNVSFAASDGDLVSIVGPVGSGKTSLLLGLLGEILCTSGRVQKHGTVAYCAQEPWIVNGTLRENITMFGTGRDSFDHEWYQTVVDACCLLPDIQLLPAGDMTEIGERGINLSGGQKARVALARAVFSKADIYLLDDPLSAVDVAVAARLIRKVFGREGLLGSKVQLVVTHQLKLLPVSSEVIFLRNGSIAHCGTFTELREEGVEFTGFSGLEEDVNKEHRDDVDDSEDEESDRLSGDEEDRLRKIFIDSNVNLGISELRSNSDGEWDRCTKPKSLGEEINHEMGCKGVGEDIASNAVCGVVKGIETEGFRSKGDLVTEEDRHLGHVTANVYHAYVKAGGGYFALMAVAAAFILAQAVRQVSEWWLSRWSTVVLTHTDADVLFRENRTHALIFLGFTVATMAFTLCRAAVFAGRTMSASKNLHNKLLDRVLHARPSFFDTNPMGRILNRFSKDMDQMDSMLPVAAQDFLQISFVALGSLITISVILPWFVLPLIPIVSGFLLLQQMYKRSSRELKRLEAVSRSPLYAQLVETANGLPTIRAFRTEDRFSSVFSNQVDMNHCAYHMFASAGRWLGIRLDGLAAMVVFSTSLVVLVMSSKLNPGLAGVALTQSIVLTGNFQCKSRGPVSSVQEHTIGAYCNANTLST